MSPRSGSVSVGGCVTRIDPKERKFSEAPLILEHDKSRQSMGSLPRSHAIKIHTINSITTPNHYWTSHQYGNWSHRSVAFQPRSAHIHTYCLSLFINTQSQATSSLWYRHSHYLSPLSFTFLQPPQKIRYAIVVVMDFVYFLIFCLQHLTIPLLFAQQRT